MGEGSVKYGSQCYNVMINSNNCQEFLTSFDTEDDAREFCERNDWRYQDDNMFVWDLSIECEENIYE